jgi:hypothetical protein
VVIGQLVHFTVVGQLVHVVVGHVEVFWQLVHCAHVVATLVVVVFAAHWAETVPVAASATNASTNREMTTFFILVLLFYC